MTEPKRPKCTRCGRQRQAELVDGKPVCRECRTHTGTHTPQREPDLQLMAVLLDRARDGATE